MLKKLFIYIVIGIGLTILPLCYINNIILGDNSTAIKRNSKSNLFNLKGYDEAKVPDEAQYIAVTYDGDFVTYIDSGKLYIKNAKNDKMYDVVEEEAPVIYSLPLNDRNIVIYFTYDSNTLAIKTYDLNKQEKTEHKTIKVSDLSKICDVRYSSYTNVIYINVETNRDGTVRNNIYRVNIMKNVSVYAWGKKIKNMEILNNKDTLVYEDSENRIYIKNKIFKYEGNKKFKLLGVDGDDNIYLFSINNPDTVYVVKDGEVVEKRQIEDPNFEGIFNRDNRVCLVYKDYVYDVVNDKKINIKPDATIIDINDAHIVYKNDDNKILIERI